MAKRGVAKLFRNGRSQAVRLPREFRFEGREVRIRVVPEGILLEPLISDTREWFAELDRLNTATLYEPGEEGSGSTSHAAPQNLLVDYLLDTNICITLINGALPVVRARFDKALDRGAQIHVPTAVAFELWYGVAKSNRPRTER